MMEGTRVEGGYVMQYSENHEAEELICKFTLRDGGAANRENR